MKRTEAVAIALMGAALGLFPAAGAETGVAIVVGPSKHPPGSHEVPAGARLLQWALRNASNVPGLRADLFEEWPKSPDVLKTARTMVFMGDTFPPHRMPDGPAIMNDLAAMMKRGAGIVCIQFATGVRAEDMEPNGTHPLLGWMGGYFARGPHHQSQAKVFQGVKISPAAPEHPVSRGWREFTLDDEPYWNNYFGPDGNRPMPNVTAFATAMLPPESPQREVVSWGIERADGGRGFAIVMPHFYKNWAHEDLRRFILNGIVWTAKVEVPAGGVRSPAPNLAEFGPESVEPQSRTPRKQN
jgi:type 1 glutamine amidotransferase